MVRKDDVNFEYFALKLINCNYRMIILYKFIRCIMEADPNGKFVSGYYKYIYMYYRDFTLVVIFAYYLHFVHFCINISAVYILFMTVLLINAIISDI